MKKLKDYVMGIDELNIIAPPEKTPAAPKDKGTGGAGLDIPLPAYDFLGELSNKADTLVGKMKDMLYWIGLIGGALAALAFSNKFLKSITGLPKGLQNVLKGFASIATLAIEAYVVFQMDKKYAKTGELKYLLGDLITTAVGSGIMYAMWGTKGLAIGLAVSALATITSLGASIKSGLDVNSAQSNILAGLAALKFGLAGLVFTKSIGGGLVGLALGAALAVTVQNFSAVASGQIKVDDPSTIIRAIVSTALFGVAGLMLGVAFATAGAGVLIGLGAGLAITIASLAIAWEQNEQQKSIDNFTSGLTTSVKDLTDAITDKFKNISVSLSPTIEAGESLKTLKEDIGKTTAKAESMIITLGIMGETTTTTFEGLASEISTILSDTRTMIENEAQLALTALASLPVGYLESMGYTESEINDIILTTTTDLLSQVGLIETELNNLDVNDPNYLSNVQSGIDKLKGIVSTSTDKFKIFGETYGDALDKMDIKKPKDIKKAFETLTTSANTAVTDINTAYDGMLSAFDSVAAQVKNTNPEQYNMLMVARKGILESKDAEIKKINDGLALGVNSIQTTMVKQMGTLSAKDLTNLKKNGFIKDIEKATSDGLKDLDSNLSVDKNVTSFSGNLMDNLFMRENKTGKGAGILKLKTDYKEIIKTASDELDITTATDTIGKKTTDIFNGSAGGGSFTAKAYNSAVKMTVADTMSAIDSKGISTTIGDKTTTGINGSKIGTTNDFKEKVKTSVTNNMPGTSFWSTVKTSFGTGLTGALNETKIGKLTTMSGAAQSAVAAALKVLPGGKMLSSAFHALGIPGFAEGGFPVSGQLFLANENGRPEMVGSMGNRSAVANTGQIVQGISQGVAQANQEEVALLREQNSLLQQLLAKNTTINLDGRKVNNQLDQTRLYQGTPLVTYG
jgi:hypothetical protein